MGNTRRPENGVLNARWLALVAVLLSGGCARHPTKTEAAADHGHQLEAGRTTLAMVQQYRDEIEESASDGLATRWKPTRSKVRIAALGSLPAESKVERPRAKPVVQLPAVTGSTPIPGASSEVDGPETVSHSRDGGASASTSAAAAGRPAQLNMAELEKEAERNRRTQEEKVDRLVIAGRRATSRICRGC